MYVFENICMYECKYLLCMYICIDIICIDFSMYACVFKNSLPVYMYRYHMYGF